MANVCYKWENAGVLWKDANWMWFKCAPPPIVCYKWGNASVLWVDADWWWSLCSGQTPPIPPIPPTASVEIKQPLGVDATTLIQPWLIEPWNPYRAGEIKKSRVIELTLWLMGQEYKEKKEKKEMKNLDIDADNVNIRINPTNIDLRLKK